MSREVIRPWPMQADHKVPYVPAIKVKGGTVLFMSGMGALPPVHRHPHVTEEWILPDDPAEQTRRAVDKIRTVVEAAAGGLPQPPPPPGPPGANPGRRSRARPASVVVCWRIAGAPSEGGTGANPPA